jgi:hypothetical protein
MPGARNRRGRLFPPSLYQNSGGRGYLYPLNSHRNHAALPSPSKYILHVAPNGAILLLMDKEE